MTSTYLTSLMTIGAAITLTAVALPAVAQNAHAGHNHQTPNHNHVEAPLPDIDHVLTESPEDHVLGANTAPITVIAYASVMCPHCAQWFTSEWPVFKEKHIDSGQVRFVFREFPTAPANYARTGFVIANCAPKERYFEQIVYQMQNQNYIFSAIQAGQARPMYQSLAYQAGLETPQQMQACFAEADAYQRMDNAMLRARKAGIQSVPSFIIDGEIYKGNSTAAGLEQAISARFAQGMSRMPVRRPVPSPAPVPAPAPEPKKSMMTPIPTPTAPKETPETKPTTDTLAGSAEAKAEEK